MRMKWNAQLSDEREVRYKGRNLQNGQYSCLFFCQMNNRRNFVFVSKDTCNRRECQAAINEDTSSRWPILRGAWWSNWEGQFCPYVKLQMISTWMRPRCIDCSRHGWNKKMWQDWGVQVQPEWRQHAWIDASGDKLWRTREFVPRFCRMWGIEVLPRMFLCWPEPFPASWLHVAFTYGIC